MKTTPKKASSGMKMDAWKGAEMPKKKGAAMPKKSTKPIGKIKKVGY